MIETREQMIERVDNFWSSMKSEESLREERIIAARENKELMGSLISDND